MSRPCHPSTAKSGLCSYPSCEAPVSGGFRCPTCNAASYCCLIHALFDARRHVRECPAYSSHVRQQRAQVRKVDFLLFPVDANTPHIVPVDYRILHKNESDGEGGHVVDWHKLFGGCIPGFTVHPVGPAQRISSSAPSSRLFLAFDERCPFEGPPLPANLCAQHLTRGQSRTPWRGTLVGYRAREPAEHITDFLDVNMADLSQFVTFLKTYHTPILGSLSVRNVTPDEFLAMLARQVARDRLEVYSDFSSTAAESIARDRIVPPEYPTMPSPSPRASQELDPQAEMLKKVIREEVQVAIWETEITIVGILLGAYGLWRFVLSPMISFFLAAFIFCLRAPFALMKFFLWPLTLFKFALI